MFKYLIDLFFPKVCAGCSAILQTNEILICTFCRHELPLTNQHLIPENEAFKSFYGKISIEYVSAFLHFKKDGIVQNLIHNLKYRGMQEIGDFLGVWYAEDLKNQPMIKNINTIVPVPLHPKKEKQRGYNQVTYFAKALSKAFNIPIENNILKRVVYTKTQTKKNRQQRNLTKENIFDVFFDQQNHNQHFLLIDDVMTTGATLEACSKALLKIPGAKISIVCMAIADF